MCIKSGQSLVAVCVVLHRCKGIMCSVTCPWAFSRVCLWGSALMRQAECLLLLTGRTYDGGIDCLQVRPLPPPLSWVSWSAGEVSLYNGSVDPSYTACPNPHSPFLYWETSSGHLQVMGQFGVRKVCSWWQLVIEWPPKGRHLHSAFLSSVIAAYFFPSAWRWSYTLRPSSSLSCFICHLLSSPFL